MTWLCALALYLDVQWACVSMPASFMEMSVQQNLTMWEWVDEAAGVGERVGEVRTAEIQ